MQEIHHARSQHSQWSKLPFNQFLNALTVYFFRLDQRQRSVRCGWFRLNHLKFVLSTRTLWGERCARCYMRPGYKAAPFYPCQWGTKRWIPQSCLHSHCLIHRIQLVTSCAAMWQKHGRRYPWASKPELGCSESPKAHRSASSRHKVSNAFTSNAFTRCSMLRGGGI